MNVKTLVIVIGLLSLWVQPSSATHQSPAPVAWWKLDETSGTTAFDETANNNDGALIGGVTQGVEGRFGTAYSFDGVNDYVQVPDSASLDLGSGDATISAWLSTNPTAQTDTVVSKGGSGTTPVYLIQIGSTGLPAFVFRDGSDTVQTTTVNCPGRPTINDGQYHLITAVRDSSAATIKLFSDGELQCTLDAALLGSTDSTEPLRIARALAGNFVTGKIDDARVYASALEDWMVMDLFLDPAHHPCDSSSASERTSSALQSMISVAFFVMLLTILAVSIPLGGRS